MESISTVVYAPFMMFTALAVLRSRWTKPSEGWLTICRGKNVPQSFRVTIA
jgi:hypothetical protein